MKKILLTLTILAVSLGAAFAQNSQKITKSLTLPQNSKDYTIKIMNLRGKVEVKGHSGTAVALEAQKTVEAKRTENAARLNDDWSLAFKQEGNTVLVYADGPGVEVKQNSRGEWSYNVKNDSKDGNVKFDIVLQVPDQAKVEASTINGGHVIIQDLRGNGSASNINGNVKLLNVTGNVSAATVNGDVEVQSNKIPSTDTDFTTVNGAIRLTFPPQLAANIQYTSVSGDFYTDYDFKVSDLKESKKKNGGTYYKIGRNSALQVGEGGPKIKITTVNGDMYLKKGSN